MTAPSGDIAAAVVGGGNMGGSLVLGLLDAGFAASRLTVIDLRDEVLEPLAQRGVATTADLSAVAAKDLVVVAVKPQVAAAVLDALAPLLTGEQTVISLMAGVATTAIEARLTSWPPVVRAMPQTLVRLRAGATALCAGRSAGAQAMAAARAFFDLVGTTVEVTESQMDAVTGLSGSGPAYVYTAIEALAAGGVQAGLSQEVALKLAAQTVAGAARMVLETGEHPAALRDRVTSPGGTTIAGLAALEAGGLRHALMAAVVAAARRARELGQ